MTTITGSNVVLSNEEFNVVGTRPIRQDGPEKVTGRARYGADISLPGLLHARVLRSPHAHARIKSIDTSKAEAMEGVRGVVTSADLPQPRGRISDQTEAAMVNPKFLSNNCLAAEKALYRGHAVAAVAATSAHVAEKALELIDVEYEVLDSVTDVLAAMQPGAPCFTNAWPPSRIRPCAPAASVMTTTPRKAPISPTTSSSRWATLRRASAKPM